LGAAPSYDVQQQRVQTYVAGNRRPVAVAVYVQPDQSQRRATVIWHRPAVSSAPLQVWDPIERYRTRYPSLAKRVAPREKESIVTKRVAFGELIFFAEFPPTYGLMHRAESESFRPRLFIPL
jgi:hypothetical protein